MKVHIEKKFSAREKSASISHDREAKFHCMPESELWILFRSGDRQVFNFIYIKYFPVLFNYGHQFTQDKELIKDVIQDLFIYLREKGDKLGGTTSIKFYLYKAYRRRILRYLTSNKNGWVGLEYHNNTGFEIALSQESCMINSDLHEELKQKLEQAFSILTKRQKEIIIYYFYEGFTYEEIASLMDFSEVQYARVLLCRSIAKLRKILGNSDVFLFLFIIILFRNF
jgi:RNA polymerase sigma-70 factor (ECF subfamily)